MGCCGISPPSEKKKNNLKLVRNILVCAQDEPLGSRKKGLLIFNIRNKFLALEGEDGKQEKTENLLKLTTVTKENNDIKSSCCQG